jgi:hypothetical protein
MSQNESLKYIWRGCSVGTKDKGLTLSLNTSKIVGDMKIKYIASIVLFTVILGVIFLGSCAPPGVITYRDWSFDFSFPFWGLPFSLIGLVVYFVPTIIAAVRRSKSILGIILLNVLAGWTFIGWVIALIWSLVGEAGKR